MANNIFDSIPCNGLCEKHSRDVYSEYLIPVIGVEDGWGLIANNCLYTVAHILDDISFIRLGNQKIVLDKTNCKYISAQKHKGKLGYGDLAIFDVTQHPSPIKVYESQLAIGMEVEVLFVEEGQTPLIRREKGRILKCGRELNNPNFVECEFEYEFKKGNSGSPLLMNNQLVGVLTGDIEGKTSSRRVVFQIVTQIESYS